MELENENDAEEMDEMESNYEFAQNHYLGDRTRSGLPFCNDCLQWDSYEIDLLHHLIDTGNEITREYFLHHVSANDMRLLETSMDYNKGFLMENDWHIKYYTTQDFHANPIFYFVHSGVEYVFMEKPEPFDDED